MIPRFPSTETLDIGSSPACISMYDHRQQMNDSSLEIVPVGCGESVDDPHTHYGTQSFEDGVAGDAVNFDGDADAAYGAEDGGMYRSVVDDVNQLTVSFRGQVFVFGGVTPEKVQAVLLLLGASESSPASHGNESASQNPGSSTEQTAWTNQLRRAASLYRFRQKRKERNFDKKVRYNVRQEVALRMQRKKGQFTSAKKQDDASSCNADQYSSPDNTLLETLCVHCGTSSKSTPMMRRGPAGPRSLCNACGLVWGTKGILRGVPRKPHDQLLVPVGLSGGEGADTFSASDILGEAISNALADGEKPALTP